MDSGLKKYINNGGFADGTTAIAILDAAEKFQSQARLMAPVDTGRLRGSITKIKDGDDYLVGSNVEYAAHQEFGTKWMKAQAFLRPTAYLMKNQNVDRTQFQQFLASIQSI